MLTPGYRTVRCAELILVIYMVRVLQVWREQRPSNDPFATAVPRSVHVHASQLIAHRSFQTRSDLGATWPILKRLHSEIRGPPCVLKILNHVNGESHQNGMKGFQILTTPCFSF